jgi:hypothetical protein
MKLVPETKIKYHGMVPPSCCKVFDEKNPDPCECNLQKLYYLKRQKKYILRTYSLWGDLETLEVVSQEFAHRWIAAN